MEHVAVLDRRWSTCDDVVTADRCGASMEWCGEGTRSRSCMLMTMCDIVDRCCKSTGDKVVPLWAEKVVHNKTGVVRVL